MENKNIFSKAFDYVIGRKPKEKAVVESYKDFVRELTKLNKIIYDATSKHCQVIVGEDIITGTVDNMTEEIRQQLKIGSYQEITQILAPKVEITKDNEELIVEQHLDVFEDNEDFDVIGNEVYFKNVKSLAIPKSIVMVFVELLDKLDIYQVTEKFYQYEEQYETMKAFTWKLLSNPIEESRNNLMDYIKKFNVKMSTSGNLVMFRNIVSTGKKDKSYIEYISKEYFRIKGNKKSPKHYTVYEDNGNYFTKLTVNGGDAFAKNLGCLHDLYQNLSKETSNTYTDNHTKSYKIALGSIYRIREEDIDKNMNGSCGGFLHLTAGAHAYDYSGFGDTSVCVLVNPMNAAKMRTVSEGKIGVTEMFICCKIDNENDIPNLANFDEEYEQLTLVDIKASLEAKTLDKFSVTDDVTSMNYNELLLMQQYLQNRIVKIN